MRAMSAPAAQPSVTTATKKIACDNCGAAIEFNPGAKKLKCEYCGNEQAIPAQAEAAPIVEHDFELVLRNHAPPAAPLGKRVRCDRCGAVVELAASVAATKCAFCGNPQVAEQPAAATWKAESLVPFSFDRGHAEKAFAGWLSGLWFRPNDLKRVARLKELSGVYLPFWTFDALADSTWNADAGYYYYVSESYTDSQGKRQTRQVQRVRWEPAGGQRQDAHDDELVLASRGLRQDEVSEVFPFDTKALKPYAAEYLAGFLAEAYAVEPREAFAIASQAIGAKQEARCSGDVPGDTQRNLRVSTRLSRVTFKHVLLPMWVAAYIYRDKIFHVLVNGQTGKVEGSAPWSVAKIAAAVVAAIALIAIIALAASGR